MVQHFTWQRRQATPGREGQWLFKMPFHLKEPETLLETCPVALFIQTHRAPSEALASWNSPVERARSVAAEPRPREIRHSYRPEDYALAPEALTRAFQPLWTLPPREGSCRRKTRVFRNRPRSVHAGRSTHRWQPGHPADEPDEERQTPAEDQGEERVSHLIGNGLPAVSVSRIKSRVRIFWARSNF